MSTPPQDPSPEDQAFLQEMSDILSGRKPLPPEYLERGRQLLKEPDFDLGGSIVHIGRMPTQAPADGAGPQEGDQ